jgi:hypothetical protein
LIRGEEKVLCPRCQQVVPDGSFCNQCGQGLAGIALNLQQLAMAGEDFWVTTRIDKASAAPSGVDEPPSWEPDRSVALADAELPDWLQELPTETAPVEVQARIYPALQPILEGAGSQSRRFLILVILLLGLMLLSLVFMVVFLLLGGGG